MNQKHNSAAARHSFETLAAIDELKSRPEFTGWFLSRLQTKADELADEVLHDESFTPEKRERLRNRRIGILEALAVLASEEQAHTAILTSMGYKRGDQLPQNE